MDLANIEKLVARYLEAETTLQEETLLRNYFTSGNVAPHLQEYSSMFQYFKQNQLLEYTKDLSLETRKKKHKWLSIAASIALLIGAFTLLNRYNERQEAEKALADTKYAFEMIAFHINKGKASVGELNKFEQTTQKIFKYRR